MAGGATVDIIIIHRRGLRISIFFKNIRKVNKRECFQNFFNSV